MLKTAIIVLALLYISTYALKYYFARRSLPKEFPQDQWRSEIVEKIYQQQRADDLGRLFRDLVRKGAAVVAIVMMVAFDAFAYIDVWAKSISDTFLLRGMIVFMVPATVITWLLFPFFLHSSLQFNDPDKSTKEEVIDCFNSRVINSASYLVLTLLALLVFKYIPLVTIGFGFALLILVGHQVYEARAINKCIKVHNLQPNTDSRISAAVGAYLEKLNYNIEPLVTIVHDEGFLFADAWTVTDRKRLLIVLNDRCLKRGEMDNILTVLAQKIVCEYQRHDKKSHALRLFILFVQGILFYVVMGNPEWVFGLGFAQPSLHASLLLAVLIISPLNIFAMIAENWYSQILKLRADSMVAKLLRNSLRLTNYFRRWNTVTYDKFLEHPLVAIMEGGDPPYSKRIRHLEDIPRIS